MGKSGGLSPFPIFPFCVPCVHITPYNFLISVWRVPKADPKTRILVQVVGLGGDSRKQEQGKRKEEPGKGEKPSKGTLLRSLQ